MVPQAGSLQIIITLELLFVILYLSLKLIERRKPSDQIDQIISDGYIEDLVKERELYCEYCGAHFKTKIGLKVHMDVRHPNERNEDVTKDRV